MGLDEHTGSLEIGKRAGVVLVGLDSPDAAGYASPEASLSLWTQAPDTSAGRLCGTERLLNRRMSVATVVPGSPGTLFEPSQVRPVGFRLRDRD